MTLPSAWRIPVLHALGFNLLLSLFIFFLGSDGQVNSFPVYLLFVIGLMLLVIQRGLRLEPGEARWFSVCAIFLVYLALTELVSPTSSEELGRSFGVGLLILGFVYSYTLVVRELPVYRVLLLQGIVLCAVTSSLVSLYLDATFEYRPHVGRMTALGRLDNPVVAALAYGFAGLVGLHLALVANQWMHRILWVICVGLLLAGIVKTGSNGVWLGMIYAVPTLVCMRLGWRFWQSNLAGIVILATVVFGSALVSVLAPDIASKVFPRGVSYRFEIWLDVIAALDGWRWLFGYGNSTKISAVTAFSFDHGHSVFFSTLFHGGLVALGLLAWLIAGPLSRIAREDEKSLGAALLGFGLLVLLVDGDQLLVKVNVVWLLFWLPLAMLISTTNVATQAESR